MPVNQLPKLEAIITNIAKIKSKIKLAPLRVNPFSPNRLIVFVARSEIAGKMIWSFHTPTSTARGARGSTIEQMCWPQAWSQPTISKDGTVYINWAFGGIGYAFRDFNEDGLLDLENPEEFSSFDFGIGSMGGPALAPGMVVVNTCHGPRAMLTSSWAAS